MKGVLDLAVVVTLGAFMAVPLAMLVHAVGGVFNLLRWGMVATLLLGGVLLTLNATRDTKSKGRRFALVLLGGIGGLLLGIAVAWASLSEHEAQCAEANGVNRTLLECDGPIGGG
ncbi:hypothetical protein [Escherichia coli]|uniref:hypothetical protein n=1 Tax=Escherichia coli TaxID=562 RepID=UPI0037540BEF